MIPPRAPLSPFTPPPPIPFAVSPPLSYPSPLAHLTFIDALAQQHDWAAMLDAVAVLAQQHPAEALHTLSTYEGLLPVCVCVCVSTYVGLLPLCGVCVCACLPMWACCRYVVVCVLAYEGLLPVCGVCVCRPVRPAAGMWCVCVGL